MNTDRHGFSVVSLGGSNRDSIHHFVSALSAHKQAAWSVLSVSICVHLWFELNRYGVGPPISSMRMPMQQTMRLFQPMRQHQRLIGK
jgi:hypothetical protein